MKTLKSIISVICIFILLICGSVVSSAVPVEECSYSAGFDNKNFAPHVEEAEIDNGCLYYALLSTAGSYAKKYYGASDIEADFNEKALEKTAGNPDIHNFGDILYKSIGCNIGNGYTITSVEFLTGKGERYLKEKISENGAIAAAIAVPNDGGLISPKYYNEEESSFVYLGGDNDKFHAISIVGWDDDYDVEKYNKDENGDYISLEYGAWICKNSYGTDFGDGGYFYMSYTTPLLYSAALEVSHVNGIGRTLKANEIINYLGFVYGVNIRAYSSSTEKITVKVGSITAFDGEVELKNGCNLITFDRPILSGQVRVNGENISTSPDTVYCYCSLLPVNKMTVKPAVKDENWIEDIEYIWISTVKNSECCTSPNLSINHIVRKNSENNCYYITPADGYSFTKDTMILGIDGFNDFKYHELYGDDYIEFEAFSTIEEAVKADYKRLKNGDGTYKKMIEFDPTYDSGRGRLKIAGQSVGSAFVNELNILTDEKGEIKDTILTFDDGSVLTVPAEVSLFKDENRTESIGDISNLEEYFAELKITDYYSKNLTVKINGVPTDCKINTENAEITVDVKISIPDITILIKNILPTIWEWIAQLFGMGR